MLYITLVYFNARNPWQACPAEGPSALRSHVI